MPPSSFAKRVTLADVAAQAGVSPSAVSIALSRRSQTASLKPETQQRILDAVRELNYQPDIRAKGLVSNKSFLVALLGRRVFDDWLVGISAGVESELRQHSCSLLTYVHGEYGGTMRESDLHRIQQENTYLDLSLARGVDGLLVIPALGDQGQTNAERFTTLQNQGMPVVQLFNPILPEIACVQRNFARGVELLLEHLWDHGHRNILHLTHEGSTPGNDPFDAHLDARLIRTHYETWMQARDRPPEVLCHALPTCEEVGFVTCGEAMAPTIARLPNRPTAIVTFNDYLACGLLRGFLDLGIRVPRDISVVGLSDFKVSEVVYPALTSIGFSSEEIGKQAARLLFLPARQRHGAQILIEPDLKKRHSVAVPGPTLLPSPSSGRLS